MTGEREQVTVELTGGGPWGIQFQGGADTFEPLTVHKIRRDSKASNFLFEGDIVITINGQLCNSIGCNKVVDIIDGEENIVIQVLRHQDEKKKLNVVPAPKTVKSTFDKKSLKTQDNGTNVKKKTIKETDGFKHTPAPVQPGQQVKAQNEVLTLFPTPEVTSLSKQDVTSTIEETDDFKHTSESVQTGQQFTAKNEASTPFPTSEMTSGLMEVESKPNKGVSSEGETGSFEQEKAEDEEMGEEKTTKTTFEKGEAIEPNTQRTEEDAVVAEDVLSYPKLEDVKVKIDPNILCDREPDISIQQKISPIPTPSKIIENKSNTKTYNQENTGSTELFNAKQFEKTTLTVQCSFWSPLISNAVSVPKGDIPAKSDVHPSSANISSWKSPTTPSVLTLEEEKIQPTLGAKDSISSGHGSLSRDLWTGHVYEPSSDDSAPGYAIIPRESPLISEKIYSSSSFYEDSSGSYPTVEEQVGLCRRIADSISTDTNQKSRSAKLFNRRVENSKKWVHGDQAEEHEPHERKTLKEQVCAEKTKVEPSMSGALSTTYIKSSDSPTKLKLILDPRHLQDVHQLRKEGQNINEHNVISPDVCLGLVKDLKSPVGKGASMFAKRRQKSEKWVVDENKVKAHQLLQSKPPLGTKTDARLQEILETPRLTIVKSPWEAALESPVGSCDAAFREFWPETRSAPFVPRVHQESGTKATSPPVMTLPVDFHSRPNAPTPKFAPIAGYSLLPSTNYDLYRPRIPRGWNSPNIAKSSSECQDNSHEASTNWGSTSSPTAQKMTFHNFNVIPKTWSTAKATPNRSTFKPVKVHLGLTK
ncbi:uncharacterized protein LOC143234015 isoform X1 [Tachypleus tridentatus]|uniref:uncharacterized protein LOC143234015 isoform X1 n=1 Tax=Tachypleus tridentatus TaxID=6853 RepID=UPI003FD0FD19